MHNIKARTGRTTRLSVRSKFVSISKKVLLHCTADDTTTTSTSSENMNPSVQTQCDNEQRPILHSWLHHNCMDYHSFTQEEAMEIRSRLLQWYSNHRRKLPWRGDPSPWNGSTSNFKAIHKNQSQTKNVKQTTLNSFCRPPTTNTTITAKHDADRVISKNLLEIMDVPKQYPVTAYGVWVSEIMLQQTRVEAVIPYWCQWMDAFPTVQCLAQASPMQVNAKWSGLGFYRRARMLHTAAQYIQTHCHGEIPNTVSQLMQLPGIGRYTACAIASIAFQINVPVVDGNVCRVLSRLRGIAQTVKATTFKDKYGWELANQIVQSEKTGAGDVNQALMELGATYCAPSGTGIDPMDPLKDFYWSTRIGKEIGEIWDNGVGAATIQAMLKEAQCSTTTTTTMNQTSDSCPVCAEFGVKEAVLNICARLESAECCDANNACKVGHSCLPLAPEKAAKKEDVLAVAAIYCFMHPDTISWLFVRRPETGLLAGQWELPSTCVWTSESSSSDDTKRKSKRKDMSDQVPIIPATKRRKALDTLLGQILVSNEGNSVPTNALSVKRKQLDIPIEHIFSHVRHTMWVEHAMAVRATTTTNGGTHSLEWVSDDGREVRWMNEEEMKKVGVTAGYRKVIKSVSAAIAPSGIKGRKNSTIPIAKVKALKKKSRIK